MRLTTMAKKNTVAVEANTNTNTTVAEVAEATVVTPEATAAAVADGQAKLNTLATATDKQSLQQQLEALQKQLAEVEAAEKAAALELLEKQLAEANAVVAEAQAKVKGLLTEKQKLTGKTVQRRFQRGTARDNRYQGVGLLDAGLRANGYPVWTGSLRHTEGCQGWWITEYVRSLPLGTEVSTKGLMEAVNAESGMQLDFRRVQQHIDDRLEGRLLQKVVGTRYVRMQDPLGLE